LFAESSDNIHYVIVFYFEFVIKINDLILFS